MSYLLEGSKNTGRASKPCEACGEVFLRHDKYSRAQWEAARFCSNTCRGRTLAKPRPACECGCGEQVYRAGCRFKRGHVGRVRKDFYRRGPENKLWRGGHGKTLLQMPEYADARKAALKRDGHACVDCGSAKRLNAHHLEPVITHPHRAFDVDNLVIVCFPCHMKRHGKEARA